MYRYVTRLSESALRMKMNSISPPATVNEPTPYENEQKNKKDCRGTVLFKEKMKKFEDIQKYLSHLILEIIESNYE